MAGRFFINRIARMIILTSVVGVLILVATTGGYALTIAMDNLRPRSTAQDGDQLERISEDFGYGFASGAGETWAHDKVFRARAAAAFIEGRAIRIFGHQAVERLEEAAGEFISKSGEMGVNVEEVTDRLRAAREFLESVFTDEFIQRVIQEIAAIEEDSVRDDIERGLANEQSILFLRRAKEIAGVPQANRRIAQARQFLVDDTRFITFLFGMRGLDPFLFSAGDILSKEYRAIVAHMGGYPYEGSEDIQAGARTIYTSLARILGFAELGEEGLRLYQEMMLHEFLDRARGRHVSPSPEIVAELGRVNAQIDRQYREVTKGVITQIQEEGSVIVSNPWVSIEKFRYQDDLGKREVFAIKGSSRVHPDIPKGKEVTITIAKADIGSIGGHGTAPGVMLEAVAEVWMEAAERGDILDFFITRVGDDISVTVTHARGKDDVRVHELIWNGFVRASVIAKDNGWYGAGQDLLADAFSGNVKGAGPSVAEITIREQKSEVLIFAQADKTAPGAFNRGLYEIFFSPNTTWRPLGPGTARRVRLGVLDFDYKNHTGRHIWFTKEDYDYVHWYTGFPDRYTFDSITTVEGEDIAAITAQRLGIIAGEYVGKDDPMFVVRSQKRFPAVGEISSAFLKGDYLVPGWMRGSNKGPFFPVSLMEAKIGIYDGPPLLAMWAFNLNNGRLTGFYDLFAANPAIRYIQDRRARRAVALLEEGFREMDLRLGPEEIEYQKGPKLMEAELEGRWEEFEPKEEAVEQRRVDAEYEAAGLSAAGRKMQAILSHLLRTTWGEKLATFAEAFRFDIHHVLSDEVLRINSMQGGRTYPILINHESLLRSSPDGIMALQNILSQLGRGGNIQFVLHIARDDIGAEEVNGVVEEVLQRINEINGGYTRITRDDFAAIVVGTQPANISRQVERLLGTSIYQVIGPHAYVTQFMDAMRIALDQGQPGKMSLMSKALWLGLELIPVDGKVDEGQLRQLDELFSQDSDGTFHVAAGDVVASVESAADEYQKEVEAAIRI